MDINGGGGGSRKILRDGSNKHLASRDTVGHPLSISSVRRLAVWAIAFSSTPVQILMRWSCRSRALFATCRSISPLSTPPLSKTFVQRCSNFAFGQCAGSMTELFAHSLTALTLRLDYSRLKKLVSTIDRPRDKDG